MKDLRRMCWFMWAGNFVSQSKERTFLRVFKTRFLSGTKTRWRAFDWPRYINLRMGHHCRCMRWDEKFFKAFSNVSSSDPQVIFPCWSSMGPPTRGHVTSLGWTLELDAIRWQRMPKHRIRLTNAHMIYEMRFYAVTTSNFAARAVQYTCIQVTGFLL